MKKILLKMFQLADKIIKGYTLNFSYTSSALEANLSFTIRFDSSKSVFRLNFDEDYLNGNQQNFTEEKTAAELMEFLKPYVEFLGEDDRKLLGSVNSDKEIIDHFDKIICGKILKFNYLSRSEGGRFEYELSYNKSSNLFRLCSKLHFIFEAEKQSVQFLNYTETYQFLTQNKLNLSS